jgi:hypothetical protein
MRASRQFLKLNIRRACIALRFRQFLTSSIPFCSRWNEQGTSFRVQRRLNKTKLFSLAAPRTPAPANGNSRVTKSLVGMSKTTKALKKQAVTSQSVAQRTTDPAVARQMTTLAEAFRAQAAALKKKNKKKK